MVNIDKINENVNNLSKNLDSLNIDSIFIEQNNRIEKIFYT